MKRIFSWFTLTFFAFFPIICTGANAAEVPLPEKLNASAAEITEMLSAEPYFVGRSITDRVFWDALAAKPEFARVIQKAEKELEKPIPVVSDELYLQYSQNGNRTNYQREIGNRNRPLRTFVQAECLENKGRFIPRIEEYIRTFSADKSWVLPAHDHGNTNFNGTQMTVDLASSALSWELATIGATFGEKLSPEVRKMLDEQLELRCFAPFRGAVLTGKPKLWWLTGTNNWNAVCLAGVTGAAMANIPSREERAWFMAAACHFIKYSENGYTDDGYCSEGVGYWNYGFGNHLQLSEILRRATDGKIRILDSEKMRNVALYGVRIEILPGLTPPFSDCSITAVPDAKTVAILNRVFGFGLPEWSTYPLEPGPEMELTPMGVLTLDLPPAKTAAQPVEHAVRDFFPDAGVLISRPNDWARVILPRENWRGVQENVKSLDTLAVAMKGGHNNEHHNHNDVGAYVVIYRGESPLLDLGAEVYTRRTFSNQRYESKLMNSWGHPVPLVDGNMQKTGGQYRAAVTKTEFTEDRDTLELDMRGAYALDFCQVLTRTFHYDRTGRGGFTVTDDAKFDSPRKFETALITASAWRQTGPDTLKIGNVTAKITVIADGKPSDAWKIEEAGFTEDFRARDTARRLAITLTEPVTEVRVEVRITPTEE